MATSAATTVSKRSAVEDDTLHPSDDRNGAKRLKLARTKSPNGDQKISKYFTQSQTKPRNNGSTSDSDDQANVSHSASKDATRKHRSMSPPAPFRYKALSKIATNQSSETAPSQPLKNKDDSNDEASTLVIVENIGDIFDALPNSLLIHACNCKGYWGKGIAAAFREKYPEAFKIYKAHCKKPDKLLIGKALLIPPRPNDGKKHYVGCVFTSVASGFKVDSPSKILDATGTAMTDLLAQAREHNAKGKGEISEIRMCKINSGLFKVKWEDTRQVLETSVERHGFKSIDVFERSEE